MNYTEKIENLAMELGVETSVAMDIQYLRTLEQRIILAAKKNPHLRNFAVYNSQLETELDKLEEV